MLQYILLIFVFFPLLSFSVTVDTKDPYDMVQHVANNTLSRISNEKHLINDNPNYLKDIVRQEMMPYIHYKYAAYIIIGKQLRSTAKKDRNDFANALSEYLVTSYAQIFVLYKGQNIQYERKKSVEGKRIVPVKINIINDGGEPIDIIFKTRYNKKTGTWKVYDMIVEGVSFLSSTRSQYAIVIKQEGLHKAIELLKEKSQKSIRR